MFFAKEGEREAANFWEDGWGSAGTRSNEDDRVSNKLRVDVRMGRRTERGGRANSSEGETAMKVEGRGTNAEVKVGGRTWRGAYDRRPLGSSCSKSLLSNERSYTIQKYILLQ
jgi:hypothetical protein